MLSGGSRRAVVVGRVLAVVAVFAAFGLMFTGTASAKLKVKSKVHKDTLTVTGTNAAENIVLRLASADPTRVEVVVGMDTDSFKRDKFDHIVVEAGGGDDTVSIDESNGVFTDTELTMLDGGDDNDTLLGGSGAETFVGGDGNDTINGGDGPDTLNGGDGNDFVDGNRGDDTASLGAGDDTFQWDPGDGSDTVEGQDGTDRMLFNGANVAEKFDISPNGGRVRFTRDIANIVMDLDDVEQIDLKALGGADRLVVNDLTGTDLRQVNDDLGPNDGAADNVTVNGTNDTDNIMVAANAGAVDVTGLTAAVHITNPEAANDALVVNGLDGNDTIAGGMGLAALIGLTVDGGSGNDVLGGGDGADQLLGGDGNDSIDGNGGNDTAFMGAGDDTFQWDPGDGNDVVEGQQGTDTMLFNGANIAEQLEVSANGGRVLFTRDVGNIVMDLNGVERIDLNSLGGADTLTVNDLSGTGVTEVNDDLGANDGAPDSVIVNGTDADDGVQVVGDSSGVAVFGVAAQTNITHAEPTDALTINALGGNDHVTAQLLSADALTLIEHGGDGDDTLRGGNGDDTLHGEAGDDILIGGPGTDILDGGPGNNILIQ